MPQPEAFTAGMRRLAAGVSLITTTWDNQRYGLIATAVTSVCAEPPTLLICVNRTASIHDHLTQAGHFCVNVLSVSQADIAMRFATPKNRETRFELGTWGQLETGAPVLSGACVNFDCKTSHEMTQGTHTVLFGQIQDVWLQEMTQPLAYHDGSFSTLAKIA
ncbi:flavin reductase family protein [Yoonia maritima]|uniref:flavin reductase family protein n=1 Tax=Yoonia maritima TaxID=1435347 RepID=UPI000D1118A4|nr:flavin reductase family protein [Yoonia maritima]